MIKYLVRLWQTKTKQKQWVFERNSETIIYLMVTVKEL